MIFASIPNDVLLIIRSYIFIFRLDDVVEADVDELESFLRQEPERSWRHFLAVSNSQSWRRVRNELGIWSLNEKSFRKYLTDDLFRRYVNERMVNPVQQLNCRSIDCETMPSASPLVAEMAATSSAGYINIYEYSLPEFPSSQFLLSLSVRSSFPLERLGDFPNLVTLQLWECPGLTTVGKMDILKQLYLKDISARVVSQFPLEQLEKLVISGESVKDFPKFSHRLKSLKDLYLALLYSSSIFGAFIAHQYPFLTSLIKLHLKYFSDVNLTGLIKLRHLSLMSIDHISGQNEVYPNLKSFSFRTASYRGDIMTFYRTKLTNVEEFTFYSPLTVEKEPLPIHNSVKSLTFRLDGFHFIQPSTERPFYKITLYDSSLPNYSMFSNVNVLNLNNCSTLMDVQCFKNIPCLHLESLIYVEDFSCLGNQRYLKISKCDGLNDEAVSHFGNIYHLCIFNCKIAIVKGLTHNQFIILDSNYSLKEIFLSGKDYIHVSARYCLYQVKIHLTGRVYSLEVTELGRSMEDLKRQCSYYNGKEV
jgi:hypothetical protein